MDAGTGFTAQIYELSPHFLHKVGFLVEHTYYSQMFDVVSGRRGIVSFFDGKVLSYQESKLTLLRIPYGWIVVNWNNV